MTQKISNPWTFDVRVRERNLKAGSLNDKDVEKYLSGLTDLSDQAESFSTPQPALEQPEIVDDIDDDIDDEDDDVQDEEPAAAAAPEAAPEAAPVAEPPADGTPE